MEMISDTREIILIPKDLY